MNEINAEDNETGNDKDKYNNKADDKENEGVHLIFVPLYMSVPYFPLNCIVQSQFSNVWPTICIEMNVENPGKFATMNAFLCLDNIISCSTQ